MFERSHLDEVAPVLDSVIKVEDDERTDSVSKREEASGSRIEEEEDDGETSEMRTTRHHTWRQLPINLNISSLRSINISNWLTFTDLYVNKCLVSLRVEFKKLD